MLMTGADYRESLRAYRPRVYINGTTVKSVADEPLLAPGVKSPSWSRPCSVAAFSPTDGACRNSPAAVARPAARSPDRRAPPRMIRARWRAQRSEVHHHCGTGAPCSTSAMRARVAGVVSAGSASIVKNPVATISLFGLCGDAWWKSRTI